MFIILRIWDTVQNTTSIIASDYVNRGCTNVTLQKGLFCLAILQVCNLYMYMPIDISFHCIFGAPVVATYKYYSRFHHYIYAINYCMLQAIGDGGQGWGNCIVYIFLSSDMRKKLFWNPLRKITVRWKKTKDPDNLHQIQSEGSDR